MLVRAACKRVHAEAGSGQADLGRREALLSRGQSRLQVAWRVASASATVLMITHALALCSPNFMPTTVPASWWQHVPGDHPCMWHDHSISADSHNAFHCSCTPQLDLCILHLTAAGERSTVMSSACSHRQASCYTRMCVFAACPTYLWNDMVPLVIATQRDRKRGKAGPAASRVHQRSISSVYMRSDTHQCKASAGACRSG